MDIQEVKNKNVQMQFKINIFTYKMCFFFLNFRFIQMFIQKQPATRILYIIYLPCTNI